LTYSGLPHSQIISLRIFPGGEILLHDALMIQFAGAYEQPAMNRWAHPMRTTIDIEDNVLVQERLIDGARQDRARWAAADLPPKRQPIPSTAAVASNTPILDASGGGA